MMMNSKWLKYPGSKWLKHQALLREKSVSPHLPETMLLTKENFASMLQRHDVVYLKPVLGGGGNGVLRVRKMRDKSVLELPSGVRKPLSTEPMFHYLQRKLGKRKYIAQQGIALMKIDDRPIDFRCLLYKTNSEWRYVGTMGKIAAAGRYTTNLCRGGKAITLKQAWERAAGAQASDNGTKPNGKHAMRPEALSSISNAAQAEKKLRDLCLQIAAALNKAFPNITELGIDAAIDIEGRIWLLEANTRPHYELFRSHEDRNLYRLIDRDIKRLRFGQSPL